MVTVLVVDDQVLIRAGLAALIRAAPGLDVVGEAATGEEAVALAASARPDVVLMDIRMPGVNGLAATERILAEGGERAPKVLILTTFDIDEYVYNALRLGASGFLLKDTPPERLISAIHTVAAGDVLLVPGAVKRLVEAFAGAPATAPREVPDLAQLTTRETEVLRAVGRALSNREIADRLHVSEATVKTHLNRLMTKLNLSSRAQAVVLAYDCGLVKPRGATA
ncbi:response regulator transcription factor [Nonomuraea roseoviolacea subsp. roseoviolacea]|uniref:DNA-binding NarL/FixJ family response regulator n=1 Tax=Nonomuraea roseoviolacea subsp. carminata TaxID=160689 RepID=A0ABT1JT22_9ACTN|nr:response regulator transcription factor [Nonomuraea roseoviolacea]MCP2344870.1 DNA-binding NarL/FixJ family response regulator [Nonomuraea roseoviolacea subsp. carminata]